MCTKSIFNIAIFCWDNQNEKNLINSLFGNNCEIIDTCLETNDCNDTVTIINDVNPKTLSLNISLFEKIMNYNGHINLIVMHNIMFKNNKNIFLEYLNDILKKQDLILFDISINSLNLKEEIEALEYICSQIYEHNYKTKLLILIDDCTCLQYNVTNDSTSFSRDNDMSIKEEALLHKL